MRDRFPTAVAFYDALYRAIEGHSPFRPIEPARPGINPAAFLRGYEAEFAIGAMILIVGAIVAVIAFAVNSDGRGKTRRAATATSRPTPVPNFQKPPPFSWPPLPRAAEVPPIVAEARGKLTAATLCGPQNPKLEWDVALPDTLSIELAMAGKDGTVYLTGSQGELLAVRDGKLQWAYKSGELGANVRDLAMDENGLLWFKIHTFAGYERYAFNRDGKGGRLPSSFENAGPPEDSARDNYSCWKNRHTLTGPQGDLDIEDNCLSVAVGPGTRIYVATDAPQILAVSKQGHVEFKYNAPCQAASLVPMLSGNLVFTCPDNTVHALRETSEIWKRAGQEKLTFTKADSAGAFYYGDGPQDISNENVKGYAHAIDAQGKDLWTVELPHPADSSVTFGAGGKMYILQRGRSFFNAAHLICLSD